MNGSLNYLWLNYESLGGKGGERIPAHLLDNVLRTRDENPDYTVNFWHNSKQWGDADLQLLAMQSEGLVLNDLNDFSTYTDCPLYSSPLIDRPEALRAWSEIDLAKTLLCSITLPMFEQAYYSDMDIAGLKLNSREIQTPIRKHGLIVGKGNYSAKYPFENQFFGFDKRRLSLVDNLFKRTLVSAVSYDAELNGFPAFTSVLRRERTEVLEGIGYIPKYI